MRSYLECRNWFLMACCFPFKSGSPCCERIFVQEGGRRRPLCRSYDKEMRKSVYVLNVECHKQPVADVHHVLAPSDEAVHFSELELTTSQECSYFTRTFDSIFLNGRR